MGRTHAAAILLLSKVVAGTALGIFLGFAPEDYVLLFFFLFSTTAGVLLYMADEPVGLLAFFGVPSALLLLTSVVNLLLSRSFAIGTVAAAVLLAGEFIIAAKWPVRLTGSLSN